MFRTAVLRINYNHLAGFAQADYLAFRLTLERSVLFTLLNVDLTERPINNLVFVSPENNFIWTETRELGLNISQIPVRLGLTNHIGIVPDLVEDMSSFIRNKYNHSADRVYIEMHLDADMHLCIMFRWAVMGVR